MENIPRNMHVTNLAQNFQFCPSLDIVKLFSASLCRLLDLPSFSGDTETLTKALQKSLSGVNVDALATDSISPSYSSDLETAPKRQRSAIPTARGKVSKRKSRATKRSETTFITANPSNFRQMVQQVTGVRFGNSPVLVVPILKLEPQRLNSWFRQMVQQVTGVRFGNSPVPILKPETQRLSSRLQGPGCLPTLDTSAFLLDHHRQQVVGPNSATGAVTGVSLQNDRCT